MPADAGISLLQGIAGQARNDAPFFIKKACKHTFDWFTRFFSVGV
jgi:hypothetical protein